MATTPFTPAFESSLKQPVQGGKPRISSGHVVSPQCFCCLSGNNVGVDKDPVSLIRAEIQDVCPLSPVCIDISGSWSPTSTIASWSIDWGDGNNSNGVWPPPASVCHPLGGYATAGVYYIELTTTDLLGATDLDEVEIIVYVCPPDPPPPLALAVGSLGKGVLWTNNFDDPVPTWAFLDIADLNVPGSRECRVIREHVGGDGLRRLIMGTDCGIYLYEHWPPGILGPDIWRRTVTLEEMCFPLLLTTTNFTIYDIQMCPDDPDHGHCLWGTDHTGGAFKKLCISETFDGWQSLDNSHVIITNFYANLRASSLAIEPHSSGERLWVDHPHNDFVYYSANGGASWVTTDTTGDDESGIFIPWYALDATDDDIYHGEHDSFRYSNDGGGSWNNVVTTNRNWWMGGSSIRPDLVNLLGKEFLHEWDPVGGLVVLHAIGIAEWMWDARVLERNADGTLQRIVEVGGTVGSNAQVWDWDAVGGVVDKTANILALIGTGTGLISINREVYSGLELLP